MKRTYGMDNLRASKFNKRVTVQIGSYREKTVPFGATKFDEKGNYSFEFWANVKTVKIEEYSLYGALPDFQGKILEVTLRFLPPIFVDSHIEFKIDNVQYKTISIDILKNKNVKAILKTKVMF